MIKHEIEILKRVKKGYIPHVVFKHIHNAFMSIDITKDLSLFDIKKLKQSENKQRIYYRLRKGKYRAMFFIESNNIFVIKIARREEVYKGWL